MKLRDTVILVVLAHVGLVLVWVCMGGCANNKAQQPKEQVAPVAPEKPKELPPVKTEVISDELPTPIMAVEPKATSPKVSLPETGTVKPALQTEKAAVEPSPKEIKIVLKKGDTLWGLSRKYKVPVSAIADRNDIQNSAMVREGRELIIPVGEVHAERPEPAAKSVILEPSSALSPGSEAVPVAEDADTAMHKVEPGDTLWTLARKYKTTSTKIMEANNITDATRLQIGQELRIPKGE